jgi:Ser/Thr protein kinase RdoA (MazF antagonist)
MQIPGLRESGSAAGWWPAGGPQDSLRAAPRHIERVDPGAPVMRSLPAAAGESWVGVPGPDSRAHLARLFRFLPGHVTANLALTTAAIWSHGQITARLGWALRGFTTRGRPRSWQEPRAASLGSGSWLVNSARALHGSDLV